MRKLKNLKHFKRKLRSFLLQHIFYPVDEYMYNYLVKYNALFALSQIFGKRTCFYNKRSKWRSTELQELIEGNLVSLLQAYVRRHFTGFVISKEYKQICCRGSSTGIYREASLQAILQACADRESLIDIQVYQEMFIENFLQSYI